MKTHSISHGNATAVVDLCGATVVSFQTDGGRDVLFCSRQAVRDGSKAIRGGIPVVFPIFGPPTTKTSTMPQHGFARVNEWKVAGDASGANFSCAIFTLDLADVTSGRGDHNMWSPEQALLDGRRCQLSYTVKVQSNALTTTLVVENTGTCVFEFECLLHTYLHVANEAAQDGSQCFVQGLSGYTCTDKVDSSQSGTVQGEDPITLSNEVDRVYTPLPSQHETLRVQVGVGNDQILQVDAHGSIDDDDEQAVVPVSCVVWNPSAQKAHSMSDFGDEEYKCMICVEPGLLGIQKPLAPGKKAQLTQTIKV